MSRRFQPNATLETLQLRAQLMTALRHFFTSNDFWECETPVLSREVIVDANLDPFVTRDSTGDPYYLQTSPEAGMKRLLSAGATAIFQVTRVMRRGESGRLHNPEFTMVEWYRVGDDHHDQMGFVESLVRSFYKQAQQQSQDIQRGKCREELSSQPFERLSYDQAFERYAGTRVLHLTPSELGSLAKELGVQAPPNMGDQDCDEWLNLLLSEVVEPQLGRDRPQFIFDYPESQAALAKVNRSGSSPNVAERFELYDRGIELCNGYHELTDANEFTKRTQAERKKSGAAQHSSLPDATLLEEAMRKGLPDCAGVALGFDRLFMTAIGAANITDVIAFPADRA